MIRTYSMIMAMVVLLLVPLSGNAAETGWRDGVLTSMNSGSVLSTDDRVTAQQEWGTGLTSSLKKLDILWEPKHDQNVQSPSWLSAVRSEGVYSEKQVESSSKRHSYLRYVLPVAITVAAGATTYILYTTRSR